MSIVRSPRPSDNQSSDGFVWNFRISERVLVMFLVVSGSFASGVAYGQAQAAFKTRDLPLPLTQSTVCSSATKPSAGVR